MKAVLSTLAATLMLPAVVCAQIAPQTENTFGSLEKISWLSAEGVSVVSGPTFVESFTVNVESDATLTKWQNHLYKVKVYAEGLMANGTRSRHLMQENISNIQNGWISKHAIDPALPTEDGIWIDNVFTGDTLPAASGFMPRSTENLICEISVIQLSVTTCVRYTIVAELYKLEGIGAGASQWKIQDTASVTLDIPLGTGKFKTAEWGKSYSDH